MKAKITLLTVVATVALAGAAFSAKAQFVSFRAHAFIPVPRVFVPVPRVMIPAPRVYVDPAPVCAPAPVYAPAPVCAPAPAYYAPAPVCAPVYRERFYAPVYAHRDYYRGRRW